MIACAALRTKKVLVRSGTWAYGNVTKSEFPLSHVTKLKLSKAWQWCVHTVADADRQYRVLVAIEPGKKQYWAWLGAVFGDDQAVIARVEFHHSHDGWHCHWKTGELTDVPRGAVKAGSAREKRKDCSGDAMSLSRADAFGVAYRVFNVTPPSGGLGI